jgi:prepilin-type N-terminal cleavage/methylation domain-containing protein
MGACQNRKSSGFTLPEMFSVLTILGIIAVVVVPQVASFTDTSQSSVAEHHISQLNAIVKTHYNEHKLWPSDLEGLVAANYIKAVPPHPDATKVYQLNNKTNQVDEVVAN